MKSQRKTVQTRCCDADLLRADPLRILYVEDDKKNDADRQKNEAGIADEAVSLNPLSLPLFHEVAILDILMRQKRQYLLNSRRSGSFFLFLNVL